MQGSHGIQERLPLDTSNSITFGAENVGKGDSSVVTQASVLVGWLEFNHSNTRRTRDWLDQ